MYRVETYIDDQGAEVDKLISEKSERIAAIMYLPNPIQTAYGTIVLTARFRIVLDPKYTIETALKEYDQIIKEFMENKSNSTPKVIEPEKSLIIP